jgi:hypothetical protein
MTHMKPRKLVRFLCLVYFDGKKLRAMSGPERAAFDRSSYAYDMKLKRAGHLVVAEALQGPAKARTVSVRGRKMRCVDGPFSRMKEPLGGFILVKAANMRQAEKIAAGIPLAKLGSIEVRPIFNFM